MLPYTAFAWLCAVNGAALAALWGGELGAGAAAGAVGAAGRWALGFSLVSALLGIITSRHFEWARRREWCVDAKLATYK